MPRRLRRPRSTARAALVAGTAILTLAAGCRPATTAATTAQPSAAPDAVPGAAAGTSSAAGEPRPRVLFIRGGSNTAGVATKDDDELSDITNLTGPHGYGQFARALADAGYDVAQLDETGPAPDQRPVSLRTADLNQYRAVVFGSNNATYSAADATIVADYVKNGGGVLFLSDKNWGNTSGAAPSSDQTFLTPFGVVMNQDNGKGEAHTAADFSANANDPVFSGVTSFSSFGVSACTVSPTAAASNAAKVLVPFKTEVQQNVGPDDGPQRAPDALDGALVLFTSGKGRGACFYDRDQFFNENLAKESHRQLGVNLINRVAGTKAS